MLWANAAPIFRRSRMSFVFLLYGESRRRTRSTRRAMPFIIALGIRKREKKIQGARRRGCERDAAYYMARPYTSRMTHGEMFGNCGRVTHTWPSTADSRSRQVHQVGWEMTAHPTGESPWKPAAVITALQRGCKVVARRVEGRPSCRSNFSCLVWIPTYVRSRTLLRQLYFCTFLYDEGEGFSPGRIHGRIRREQENQGHWSCLRTAEERKGPRLKRERRLERTYQWRNTIPEQSPELRSLCDEKTVHCLTFLGPSYKERHFPGTQITPLNKIDDNNGFFYSPQESRTGSRKNCMNISIDCQLCTTANRLKQGI